MNVFKSAIKTDQCQIGLWQALASPYTAEICAGSGCDWMLFDAEHGPNDLPLLLSQLQAVAAYPVEPVVRIAVGDAALIKQVLDIGARTILVPMVESAEQAAALVSATRYPPRGIRGVASAISRASRWNRTPDYLQQADGDICLLLQVESRTALAHISAIAQVEGVDGIFVGPADLAASMDRLGNPTDAAVQKTIDGAMREITACGRAAGILASDVNLARRYIQMGARFVAVGTDVTLLARGADSLIAKFKGTPVDSFASGY